ncbi:helix-turn-helix transcriptional regulator [Saccharopolyspora sp. NFXS83]|uniref:helix-turn-helix transcriptional regulator n=1 Tax=Saccharopolyspora sp. NFXS83 TaxID=2993560 RepID=UPI00224AF77B|nr:helix-turn-helix transcriptional regulator [Saccharopolyspora sp. NFXS83]MCX2731660.1 helix-turn-helix transcriptional regulator [Saccharopolyspora sp. NFXS83]
MAPYVEHPVPGALHEAVSCGWMQEVPSGGHVQRVLPDGCLDLIWRDGVLEMAGPDTGPRLVPLAAGGIAGLRMRPGAARLLLGEVPAAELRDRRVELGELWGPRARPVLERLAATARAAEASDLLVHLARTRLPEYRHDAAVAEAVRLLGAPGPPSVAALSEHLGLSPRHLRRRFTAAVGYGPSTLVSVLRFQRARSLDAARLTELAATAGYADQAHLSRQVRRLSGLTAAELLSSRTRAGSAARRS